MVRANNQATRDRICEVAASLFAEQGYEKTTIRQVADAYGVESATLYYYMKNKEDLLLTISVDCLTETKRVLDESLDSSEDPLSKLRSAVELHMATVLRSRDRHRVMLTELRALSEDNQRKVRNLRDDYESVFENLLIDAQDTGDVRSDVSAKYLRLALLGLVNWSIFWYRPSGELPAHEIGKMFADVFLKGVGADRKNHDPLPGPAGLLTSGGLSE